MSEYLRTLTLQSVDDFVELCQCEAGHEALCTRYVLLEQVPNDFGVAGAHHKLEHILLASLLLLAFVVSVAADKQEDNQCHQQNLCQSSSVEHN